MRNWKRYALLAALFAMLVDCIWAAK